jgi:hypothetical protein
LSGTWHDLNTGKTYPFYLSLNHAIVGSLENRYLGIGANDEEIVDRAAQRFLAAFKRGDRIEVAEGIRYPIVVELVSGGKKTIKNSKEFVQLWDKIYSKGYFERALADAIHKHMFVTKYDMAMLGQKGGPFFDANGMVVALGNF